MTGATRGVDFALSHEQFSGAIQVRLGIAAEATGFHALRASDHAQP